MTLSKMALSTIDIQCLLQVSVCWVPWDEAYEQMFEPKLKITIDDLIMIQVDFMYIFANP